MSIQNRTTIKGYFETGDKPTEAQFVNFIDSFLALDSSHTDTVAGSPTFTGVVNINNSGAAASDYLVIKYSGTADITIAAYSSNRLSAMRTAAVDNGADVGWHILLQRNSNISTPAAGYLILTDKGNQGYRVWPDDSGLLRINTADPTFANDAAGTVVGDQTSMLAAKDLLPGGVATEESLEHLIEARGALRRFRYKEDEHGSRRYSGQEFFGLVTDYAPRYAKDSGRALNEITLLGDLVNAVTGLAERVKVLEAGT